MSPDKPEETDGDSAEAEWFALADRKDMDRRIIDGGKIPRIGETVKDAQGNLLIRKYDKLTKPIWQKYRAMPDARPLIFVCDLPMFVVDGVNTTFLAPDDIQRFGALYSQWRKDTLAEQFFNEANKSGSVEALVNAGVFWYHRGEGVMDNFTLAKRHFLKARDMMLSAPVPPDQIRLLQKVCRDAIDEIEYREAPLLGKIIRFIIRLLTLNFETIIPYVGPCVPSEMTEDRIKMITDAILKKEFELKRLAFTKYILYLNARLSPADAHLQDELHEIDSEYGQSRTPDMLDVGVQRLGEFVAAHPDLMEADESKPKVEATGKDAPELTVDDVCAQMATPEEIERSARRFRLISVGEIEDLAGRAPVSPGVMCWLIRDKLDATSVMERLLGNTSVPEMVKELIRRKHFSP